MEDASRKVAALVEEVERLNWRIATLETVETECARALAALDASEARYRRLLDEAGFPITISTTADAAILFANPLACRMFGLEGPRPAGRRILEFYPEPADRQGLVEQLRSQGIDREREVVMRDGQGRARTLIVTASLITYEGQEALLATSNDITDRRRAEALFRSVVEASPDGIGITDLAGVITYASPRALEIFGYGHPEGLLGRNMRDLVPVEEHPRVQERLQTILAGQHAGPSEWTGLRRDGSTFPQETNGEVLRNPDGTPRAFFYIVRDLTNRKRLERALRWGEKLESLGLMAAGIAHELNNAFQVTQGNLELAQDLGRGDGRLAALLDGVGEGVDRAAHLAREMLAYSSQSLRQEAQLQLNKLVEEVLDLRREYLRSSELKLAFAAPGELPPVFGDEGQLMKVLSALVLNALEAMEGQGGAVQISTSDLSLDPAALKAGFWPVPGREGRFVQVEVRDSGLGIPVDRLERVCDPFFTTKGQGRGLGLAVTLGILRAHSACLQLLSEPGVGTRVRVYLPVAKYAPASLPAGQPCQPTAAGILVAEDDDAIRELVVRMLTRWGYQPILVARNGAEALELFQAQPDAVGLLLTDATMPRMSGPEAFEAMRRLRPSLRGILMSGFSEAFGQGTAASFGFTGALQKPFNFATLKARLDEARASGATGAP